MGPDGIWLQGRERAAGEQGRGLSWRRKPARVASWGYQRHEGRALSGERAKGTPRCPGWDRIQMVEP